VRFSSAFRTKLSSPFPPEVRESMNVTIRSGFPQNRYACKKGTNSRSKNNRSRSSSVSSSERVTNCQKRSRISVRLHLLIQKKGLPRLSDIVA
jgi:hypothetical protein